MTLLLVIEHGAFFITLLPNHHVSFYLDMSIGDEILCV